MKHLTPKQSLTRRSRQLQAFSFITLAIGIFLLAAGILLSVIRLVPPTSPSVGFYNFISGLLTILGIIGILAAIAMFIRGATWRTDNDLAAVTGNFLAPNLPDSFVYIRNVSKREIGYVDAVLIGLPGVLVFRILDNRGIYANEGANWVQMNSRQEWLPARIKPTAECIADIDRVRAYLLEHMKVTLPVFGIVVFTQDPNRVSLALKNNVLPVTHLSAIMTALQGDYMKANRMGMNEVNSAARLIYGEPL